jgi:GH15 family glucan-1,4-alpha-glucosidase
MASRIEDYALIGDCHTGALVGLDGSIDWLCLPRFDSASTFGALLGTEDQGRWLVAPTGSLDGTPGVTSSRHYVEDTFTLVTRWVTPTGEVDVIDLMPHGDRRADVIRRIVGVSGSVEMRQELRVRFDYGAAIPWMRQVPEEGGNAVIAVAGPDALVVRGPVLTANDHAHTSTFAVGEGEIVDITLTWYPAHRPAPAPLNVSKRIRQTQKWWQGWSTATTTASHYSDAVRRSLLVLRALSHEDTGGIVAAATTSVPEEFGGTRNWDYRYVWLRDASLTLHVLLDHGFEAEADPWRGWLLRALAGDPGDVQIMYGLSGERRLNEYEITSLPGYDGASPVRIGNGAFTQYQGDVFGEVMLALERAREMAGEEPDFSWPLQRALMSFVEENWQRPDNGIWEIRGPLRHFTHSRAMLWAAFDCAARAVRDFGLDGPVERWERMRDLVRDEIEEQGFDAERNTYTQYYGGDTVDASLLQLVQCGYIAADDPRMLGTVAAIEHDLLEDGLLLRYRTESGVDGLPSGENPFLACSFWLAEQYARSGRLSDATTLMDRLIGFGNDVGLFSEEYDVQGGRQAGNTPQAFSHLSLVRAADAIAEAAERADAPTAQAAERA